MTRTPPHPDQVPAPDPAGAASYHVVRVGADLREKAAVRLVGTSPADRAAAKRFLSAAREHAINLNHFYASVAPGGRQVREVCLAVPGAGRTAMLFTSNPQGEAPRAELARVIESACATLTDTRLAQVLLDPAECGARAALSLAGFLALDELLYLRRPRPRPDEFARDATLPESVAVRAWRPGDDPAIAAALEASYVGTMDCPELCGLRTMEDVLASHRATGSWEPSHWWLISDGEHPSGALLFNPCPEQDSVELVYFGLAPALRGRGLASAILSRGLAALSQRRETTVACAVDARNTPARRLYERFGFIPFGRRAALVRALRTP